MDTCLIALDETPPIDIDYHASFSTFTSQEIKSAYSLSEGIDHVTCILDFFGGKLADETGFFAVGITPNKAVHHRRFAGLGVREVWSNSVDFDVLGWPSAKTLTNVMDLPLSTLMNSS